MKILKIRFQNIHSLKGEHEIDFANGILAEAGLFAITGPTGSGKSSLLDVITLALYNRIARVERTVTNTVLEEDGGIMTRNTSSCYAEVEYLVNEKTYRSHWSIERNRNNNLNARKQELVDVISGTILESGTKTPDKNEELIRLSYEQFVKAMVLSQGEFSKLLQAPRNERNKLLEDITGAKSYRNIGRAVFQRYAAVKKKVELKEAGLDTIHFLTKEEVVKYKADLKAMVLEKPNVLKSYEEQRDKIETRKKRVEAQKEQENLAEKAIKLNQFFKDFEDKKSLLIKHEQLAKYAVHLQAYDLAKKEYQKIEQQQKDIQEKKAAEEVVLKSFLNSIEKLTSEIVTSENASTKLEHFRSSIIGLQAVEKSKKEEAVLYENQLNGQLRRIREHTYEIELADTPDALKTMVKRLQLSVAEQVSASGVVSLKELEQELERLRVAQETASLAIEKQQQLTRIKKELGNTGNQLLREQENLKNNSTSLESLEKEQVVLRSQVRELKKILDHQRMHQSLDEQRLKLKDQEPCPLCGALEHPFATDAPNFDVNEDRLKDKELLLDKNVKLSISLQENNKFRAGEIERIKSEIQLKTKEVSEIETPLQAMLSRLEWNVQDDISRFQLQKNTLDERVQLLQDVKPAFSIGVILKELSEPLTLWEKALADYGNAKRELAKRYGGTDIDAESTRLSTQIIQSTTSLKTLEIQTMSISKEMKKIAQEEIDFHKKLDSILEQENIKDLQQLRTAILSEETAKSYRDKKTELDSWKMLLSEKETANSNILKVLLEKDETSMSPEQLGVNFNASKEKWETLSMSMGKLSQVLENDEKTREGYKKIQIELDNLKKDQLLWKTMNDLIGDSYGNKFSNFVQDLTLEQLIGYANKRLSQFTDRYILDIPTANEAEKSDTLKIFDTYMGNARRSVRTLSGGETFLVSLAMAFALSDIASRNVKIESLFIDEGFGTLDPETLDQAITILEKMQNEGDRSVGVISHVGALKERITTQIQLDKSSLGHSQIRIVQ